MIPGDVGCPLTDLSSPLTPDDALLTGARTVLQSQTPIEREIEGLADTWYSRRVLPYRAQSSVVITYIEVTEPKRAGNRNHS